MISGKDLSTPFLSWTLFLLLALLTSMQRSPVLAQHKASILKGTITDAATHEPLMGVSVFLPDIKEGTTSGLNGEYFIKTDQMPGQVRFSYLGYKTLVLPVYPAQEQVLDVKLEKEDFQLEEVVVRGKSGRYRNKNNPAVELIRQVIAHKAENRPQQYEYLEYEQYEKMQLSLVNTPEKLKKNLLFRRYDFITSSLDTSTLPGKALLPIILQEKISQQYYRKEPESRQSLVKAEKMVDFGEHIDQKGISAYMSHMYQDIDLYENNITILTNQFLSPVADMAPTFYKYHLVDTIRTENGQKLAELQFEGRNPAAFMFTGTLFVTLDGAYAVQNVSMEISKSVSINWLRSMQINLAFEQQENGRYFPLKTELKTDFSITPRGSAGFYGERVVSYQNYQLNKPRPDSLFEEVPRLEPGEEPAGNDEAYWASHRHEGLTETEAKTYANIDHLTSHSSYKRTMDIAVALLSGYTCAGPYAEIGPLSTFYSFNPVEGFRLRLGGRTTPSFSKKFFFDSYAAYGFKDERWKFGIGGSYSLTERTIFEFPVKAIRASYKKDTRIPGQELQNFQEGSFLLSFQRGENDKWLYNETYDLSYLHEFRNNFSYQLGFRNTRQAPAGSLEYIRAGGYTENDELIQVKEVTTSEVSLELRWAPNEKFFQGKVYRTPVASRHPVFTLRSGLGIEDFFEGQYSYQNLMLNVYKRFYLSQLGYSDVVGQAGYTFGQLPFPLLTTHRANQTYAYQLHSYNLMNFLEFVSDQYFSIHIDHTFNGFIFNKIPLLKKTKFREFVSLKALYGSLREENRPTNQPGLIQFPNYIDGQQATYRLGSTPYLEASVGVGNILNFFRIDLVRRFTYLDHPYVSDLGIRGRFKFDF